MPNLSFDITSSKHFYDKLIEDYKDYQLEPTSARLAINCAMTAWHLGEWLYEEFKSTLINSHPDAKGYLIYLKSYECQSLEIMQRITNGSKHCSTPGPTSKVQDTEKHIGPFSSDFSREFDQTSLIIKLDDGTEVWFEDELDKVVRFWQEYIPRTFNLNL